MADDDDNAAKQCRFCLDGALDGDFVAPCECRGGQRWVHLTILGRDRMGKTQVGCIECPFFFWGGGVNMITCRASN